MINAFDQFWIKAILIHCLRTPIGYKRIQRKMLTYKKHSHLIIRMFSNAVNDQFTFEQLGSAKNRERCMKLMKRSIQLTKKQPDSYASVLVPIVCDAKRQGAISILFTIRSANMRTHHRQVAFPGEFDGDKQVSHHTWLWCAWCDVSCVEMCIYRSSCISLAPLYQANHKNILMYWYFAGGIKDPDDATFVDCALRETEEEIGIARNTIDVWGEGQLVRPRNGPAIMPVVGYVRDYKESNLRLNANEVEKAFTVPIQCLSSLACRKHTQFRTDKGYTIPVYTCGEQRIWGITAVITNLFLHSLLPADVYDGSVRFVRSYKPKMS